MLTTRILTKKIGRGYSPHDKHDKSPVLNAYIECNNSQFWRNFPGRAYLSIMTTKKVRRLIVDIEVSPNTVFTWNTGWKLIVPVENIVEERKIICICWKWEGEREVHCLEWKKGCDKALLEKFIPILEQADEVIGHNSDRFDIPWIRTRCIFHGIPVSPHVKGVDTLKLARKSFRFNSNKLNYIASFLGLGSKLQTDFNLWKEVVAGDSKALARMVRYCKNDVLLTEKVYHKLESYGKLFTHAGALAGRSKTSCPRCASESTQKRGSRVSAAGVHSPIMHCRACGRHFTVTEGALKG